MCTNKNDSCKVSDRVYIFLHSALISFTESWFALHRVNRDASLALWQTGGLRRNTNTQTRRNYRLLVRFHKLTKLNLWLQMGLNFIWVFTSALITKTVFREDGSVRVCLCCCRPTASTMAADMISLKIFCCCDNCAHMWVFIFPVRLVHRILVFQKMCKYHNNRLKQQSEYLLQSRSMPETHHMSA